MYLGIPRPAMSLTGRFADLATDPLYAQFIWPTSSWP